MCLPMQLTVLVHAPEGALPESAQEAGQEAGPGSRLSVVVDGLGRQVDRRGLAARERMLLCEVRAPVLHQGNPATLARGRLTERPAAQCLVYALHVQPRVLPGDVEALVDLLHSLALRTRGARWSLKPEPCHQSFRLPKGLVVLSAGVPGAGTGAGDMAAQHHAAVVLLALLLALLPGKPADAPEEAEDADDQALGARPTPALRLTVQLRPHALTACARRRPVSGPGLDT